MFARLSPEALAQLYQAPLLDARSPAPAQLCMRNVSSTYAGASLAYLEHHKPRILKADSRARAALLPFMPFTSIHADHLAWYALNPNFTAFYDCPMAVTLAMMRLAHGARRRRSVHGPHRRRARIRVRRHAGRGRGARPRGLCGLPTALSLAQDARGRALGGAGV